MASISNSEMNLKGAFDSHCHLEGSKDPFTLIKACEDAGMAGLITCCARIQDLETTLKLSSFETGKKKFVFYTLGLHPVEAVKASTKEINEYMLRIRDLTMQSKSDKPVAIGEVGLDYFLVKDKDKREQSKEIFIDFVNLAEELRLPVVIHCRDAYPDLMDILSSEFSGRIIFHYFNQPDYLKEIVDKKWFVSIPLTLSKTKIAKTIEATDLERVLIETDSPAMLTEKEITPLDLDELINKIHIATGIEREKIVEKTTENTRNAFSLSLR